jgi:hypothetical protein
MPFAIAIVGGVLVLVAVRNTHGTLATLLKDDFTGSQGAVGFIVWIGAILAIGAMGYVPALKIPSRMLLALVFLSLFIANQGVFTNIANAIRSPPAVTPSPAEDPLPKEFPVHVTGASSGGGPLGAILGGVKAVAGLAGG